MDYFSYSNILQLSATVYHGLSPELCRSSTVSSSRSNPVTIGNCNLVSATFYDFGRQRLDDHQKHFHVSLNYYQSVDYTLTIITPPTTIFIRIFGNRQSIAVHFSISHRTSPLAGHLLLLRVLCIWTIIVYIDARGFPPWTETNMKTANENTVNRNQTIKSQSLPSALLSAVPNTQWSNCKEISAINFYFLIFFESN